MMDSIILEILSAVLHIDKSTVKVTDNPMADTLIGALSNQGHGILS